MKTETENLMSEKEELIDLSYWIAVNLFEKHSFEPHPVNNSLCEICNCNCMADIHVWPHYSKDNAAAMQVLEKCIPKSDHIEFSKFPNGDFRCFDWNNSARAETLPLAICRFAKAIYSK